jgi:hypothetical protein
MMPAQPVAASVLALLGSLFLALKFTAPSEWGVKPSTSPMRIATYTLPPGEGAKEDAEAVVYHFPGGAGSVEQNVERWKGQFDPKDGEPKVTPPKAGDKPRITWVEIGGTYVAETQPGSGVRLNKPNWRLFGAIIETEDGIYFVKAVGPKATIEKNADALRKFAREAKEE